MERSWFGNIGRTFEFETKVSGERATRLARVLNYSNFEGGSGLCKWDLVIQECV